MSKMYSRIENLLGKVVLKIDRGSGDEISFVTPEGTLRMFHYQDCCEIVTLEDICGGLDDLIGSPILQAEEVSGKGPYEGDCGEVIEWTFYKLATIKGSVTLRWWGSSNGYYSTGVDIEWAKRQ